MQIFLLPYSWMCIPAIEPSSVVWPWNTSNKRARLFQYLIYFAFILFNNLFHFFFFNNLWLSSTTEIQTIHSKDKLLEGLCSFHFILICKCCGIYKIDLLSIVNKKYIAMFDYLRMISLLSVIASQSIFSLTFGFLPICWVEVCSKCISSIN